jgi:cytochrome c biogenesis protein CcdA
MDTTAIAFAFSAGMLASVNPCGFSMLPAFITFYIATSEDKTGQELHIRLLRSLWLGLWVTLGFLAVFVSAGILLASGGRILIQSTPWLGVFIGFILILLGIRFQLGKSIVLPIPIPQFNTHRRDTYGMFLYGVAYASVSLTCTLPVFLSVFAGALAVKTLLSAVTLFFAYSLGMGTVITTLALATALFQSVISQYIRNLMPYIKSLSAFALILAGLHLVYYQFMVNSFMK